MRLRRKQGVRPWVDEGYKPRREPPRGRRAPTICYERPIGPLFPFGFGLSYTTFAHRDLRVSATVQAGEPVHVSVTVENTGDRAGKEVVQLYVHDKASGLVRPPKELQGFAKVSLEPGESTTVEFTLDERALSFFDPYRMRWVAEPGEFEVLVGSSSRDIRAQATFTLLSASVTTSSPA